MKSAAIIPFRSIASTIDDYAPVNDGGVYYHICTEVGTGSAKPLRTEAWKRFSDFDDLHKKIKQVKMPWLPSKVFGTDPSMRMDKLENYLNQLYNTCGGDPELFPDCLCEFLCLPDFSKLKGVEISGLKENNKKVRLDSTMATNTDPSITPKRGKKFMEPSIPGGFHDNIQGCFNELERVAPLKHGMQGWKKVGTINDIEAFVCNETAPVIRKVQGLVNCPPRMMHDLLWNPRTLKRVLGYVEEVKEVGRLDNHTKLEHFVTKSIPFVAARDIILLRHWRTTREGEIVHCEFDVDHPDVPIGEKYTRAEQSIGGTYILPVKNNPCACQVVFISNYDSQVFGMSSFLKQVTNGFVAKRMLNKITRLQEISKVMDMKACLVKGLLYNSPKVTNGKNATAPGVTLLQSKNFEERESMRGRSRHRTRSRARTSVSPSFKGNRISNVAPRSSSLSRHQQPSFNAFEEMTFKSDGFEGYAGGSRSTRGGQTSTEGNIVGYLMLFVLVLLFLAN